jgi:hypothetical protein
MTTVVNKRTDAYDIYCGRGSIFGNPYEIGIDGTREKVIERYKVWFNFCLRDPIFKREVLKLKGKKLGCFCAPLDCHGRIIKEYLDKKSNID